MAPWLYINRFKLYTNALSSLVRFWLLGCNTCCIMVYVHVVVCGCCAFYEWLGNLPTILIWQVEQIQHFPHWTAILIRLFFSIKIIPLKSDVQPSTSLLSCRWRWNRQSSTTVVLYALPLALLIVLTRDNSLQKSDHTVAQKVAEIYEDDHVIIAFVHPFIIINS